jgi:hypothetical protein
VKEERGPSRPASTSFKPSRYSASHRAESVASALDQIIEHVPPIGGGAGAVVVDEIVSVVASY